jgi:hypothetical protein
VRLFIISNGNPSQLPTNHPHKRSTKTKAVR